MASYTMQLREYIEQVTQYEEMPIRNRIAEGRQYLFDFDYPFFDEEYRNVFETNFIRNFYMREIGFETEALFKFQLETWLSINMPYFNKLFESELLRYDVLTNLSVNDKYTKNHESNQTGSTDNTGNVKGSLTSHDEGSTSQKKTGHEDDSSTTNKTIDSTSQTDIKQHSTGSSDTDQTTSNKNTSHAETDTTNKTVDSGNSFDRGLTSDTPDSRLAITTNDGAGVIEYASEIKENSGKTNSTSDVTGSSTSDSTSNDDGTLKSGIKTSSDDTIDNDNTTHVTEKDTFTGTKDNTETITGTSTNDGTKSTNTDSTGNQKTTGNVVTLDEYVDSKVGKIGAVSYPQLVKEYRESLLRVEKQIFGEMNELFMLVY